MNLLRAMPSQGAAPTRPASAAAVVATSVTRDFNGHRVLDALNLTIGRGEFVALLGASGSGKTTLLRLFAGLDAPNDGEIWLTANRAVVFQEPRLLPSRKVWRNVLVGLSRKTGRERAEAMLAEVGVVARADAWPSTLSGGEAQRVALARALVREPDLLLLDEPFASLDALTRLKMQQMVADLWRRHRPAVLLVTHDVEEAIFLADRIILLETGAISYDRTVDLPHPRTSLEPQFSGLRKELLSRLGVTLGD